MMEHGGDLSAARAAHPGADGGEAGDWLDLSTGINPLPYPHCGFSAPAIRTLPEKAALDRLLAAARSAYRVPDGAGIVAAPGTQALIQWLPRLAPPGGVTVIGPTYSEHARAWRDAGRQVVEREDASFRNADDAPPHLLLVNPNNPDGRLVGMADLARLAGEARSRGGWLIIDEAFVDVMPQASAAALCADAPVVILRSFGKFFGLAGLRLGFAIAPPAIADAIARALGPWAVAGPALTIGARALADFGWQEAMRARLDAMARDLDAVLTQAGLAVIGGTSLYRLVRAPDAYELHARLAGQRIWVRRFDWADDLLRFGLPPDAENLQRLARALTGARAQA